MHENYLSEHKPIRVLHVFRGMNSGGVESFIINLFTSLKTENVHFDFLLRSDRNDKRKIDFFQKNGSIIYYTADWPLKILKNKVDTRIFFQRHADEYDFIHIHANSLIYTLPIKLSIRYMKNAKVIIHSHNTQPLSPYLRPIHYINRIWLMKYHTINLACSKKAGMWMFKNDFSVIPNGIDTRKFQTRNHRSIQSELRLVSVGRLERQKNYDFIIPVIKCLVDMGINVTYKIAGEGTLRGKLERKIAKSGLLSNISLLGNCNDIAELLNQADIFLMPSLYEGLSIAHLEAQCIGIPCILSDTIPDESCVVNNVYRLPLDKKKWVDTIIAINRKEDKEFEVQNYKIVTDSKFCLKKLSQKMLRIYRMENFKWSE